MKLQWKNTLRTSLCAAALLSAGWAQAQTQQPAAEMPAPPAMHHPHDHEGAKHHSKKHHHKPHKHHKHHHKSGNGKYANPHQHERAAVEQERRHGKGPDNPHGAQMNEFERNALRRCDIFKTHEDRSACVQRVRQPQVSGSVQGGGVLREYTQTVTVPAPEHAGHQAHPAVHQHMVHPSVQPMRPAQ